MIRNAKTFWTGVLYLVVGVGAVWAAQENPMGSLSQMGPAYFPTVIGVLLAALGVVLMGLSFVGSMSKLARVDWARVWPVMAGPALFAMMLKGAGLVLSLTVLGLVVRLATHEAKWYVSFVLASVLAVGISLLFVGVMGLQVSLWPEGL